MRFPGRRLAGSEERWRGGSRSWDARGAWREDFALERSRYANRCALFPKRDLVAQEFYDGPHVVRDSLGHRGRALLPASVGAALPERPHGPAEVVADEGEERLILMTVPVLGEGVGLAGLAGIAVAGGAVGALHEGGVDVAADGGARQGLLELPGGSEDLADLDADDSALSAMLVDDGVDQVGRGREDGVGEPSTRSLALLRGGDPVLLQEDSRVAVSLVGGEEVRQPSVGPGLEVPDQGALVGELQLPALEADAELAYGVQDDVAPVIPQTPRRLLLGGEVILFFSPRRTTSRRTGLPARRGSGPSPGGSSWREPRSFGPRRRWCPACARSTGRFCAGHSLP